MPDPTDTLRVALDLLSGEVPAGWAPFTAIGWDAERKVLSFKRHYDEWVNLWIKEPREGGVHHVEQNNGAAAGTVLLWERAEH